VEIAKVAIDGLPGGNSFGRLSQERLCVVAAALGCGAQFRLLARDFERLPETFAGLHFLAFVMIMLKQFFAVLAKSP
jgi:hypothetical protein